MRARGTVFTTPAQNPNLGMWAEAAGVHYYPFFIKAAGKVAIELGYLIKLAVFADDRSRKELIARVGASLSIDLLSTHPRGEILISIELLQDADQRARLFEVMQFVMDAASRTANPVEARTASHSPSVV